MMRLLLSCTYVLLSSVIAALGSSPVAVNWSTKSYGPDGPWQVTHSNVSLISRMTIDAKGRQSQSKWAPTHLETPCQPSTFTLEDCMDQRSIHTYYAAIIKHPSPHVLPTSLDFTTLTTLPALITTALPRRQPLFSGNGEAQMRRLRISARGMY